MRRIFKSDVLVEREKEDDKCFSQNDRIPPYFGFFELKITGQYLLELGHNILNERVKHMVRTQPIGVL